MIHLALWIVSFVVVCVAAYYAFWIVVLILAAIGSSFGSLIRWLSGSA